MNLKMKIQKQSNLLTFISPSRLTEEILKIINSEKAAEIVDLLDKSGLYCYLQPQAASLMRKSAAFRRDYLRSMAALKGAGNQRGQALSALFRDYLESVNEWKPGSIENFGEIFRKVRSFVLPMNPPRYEMEYALKKFLAGHGISIRKPALDKPKTAGEENAPKPAKKRRRRRKPKSKPL